MRIRLDGAEIWDVREYVREKVAAKDPVWGKRMLSDSQLYRYLQGVDELIAESCKGERPKLFDRHLAQRRALYGRAVNTGDLRTALSVLRDEAELLQLYPPRKTELTGKDGGPLIQVIEGIDEAQVLGTAPAPALSPASPPGPDPADAD